ncbi:MAG: 50S ribosomal protein L18 [Candidatus Levyibacteriota bacterium]
MEKGQRKLHRQKRVRAKVQGTTKVPRLSVHRTSKYIYAQIIDDVKHATVCGISEKEVETKGTKMEKAKALGVAFGKKVKQMKIEKVVFDKGSFRYHGRVKAFAEGAREGGLVF